MYTTSTPAHPIPHACPPRAPREKRWPAAAKLAAIALTAVLAVDRSATAQSGALTTVDFETYPDGSSTVPSTLVAQQYLPAGVLFSPEWNPTPPNNATRVLQEGSFGFANFGNSSPRALDIGYYGESVDILFVDPLTRAPRAVSYVEFVAGDGDSGTEEFEIRVYDLAGNQISFTHVTTAGVGHTFVHSTLAPVAARVHVRLSPTSNSGAAIDDLRFSTVASVRSYGGGLGGTLGVPALTSSALPRLGTTVLLQTTSSAQPPTFALFLLGFAPSTGTLFGAPLHVVTTTAVFVPLTTGGGTIPLTAPAVPSFAGVRVYGQTLQFDATTPEGVAASNGLELVLGI